MRTYSTLIPFVTLAVALAANAAPPTYSSSEGSYTHTALIRDAMHPDGFVEARSFADDDRYLFERSPPSSSDAPPPPPSGAQDTSPGGARSPAAVPGSLFSGPSPYAPPTKPLPPIPQGSPQFRREAAQEHHNLPAPEGGEKKDPPTQQKVEGPHHTGQAPHPVDEKKNPEHSPPPPVPTRKPGLMDKFKGFKQKAQTSAKDPNKQAALKKTGKKWAKYAGFGLGGAVVGAGITSAALIHEGGKGSAATGSSGSEGTASTSAGNTDATTGGGTSSDSSSSDTSSGTAGSGAADTSGSDTSSSGDAPKLVDLRIPGDLPPHRPLPPIPKPKAHSQPPAPPAVPARNPNRPTIPKSHERVPSNDSTVPNFSRPLTHSPGTSLNGLTPDKNEPGAKTNETAVVKSNRSTANQVAIAGALMAAAAGGGMAAGYGMGEESNGKETETSDSNETSPDPNADSDTRRGGTIRRETICDTVNVPAQNLSLEVG
ncbi:hypothetical protein EV359DRAFT_82645 [Lentinula novae-zelandiae]|nr:hypothetical protein EV359DRAFT_82645 [Lentinula novae-zelandiae]